MKVRVGCLIVFLSFVLSLAAQTVGTGFTSSQVPPLIQFSNVATDEGGSSLSGVVSITFLLYGTQQGGAPLWAETQNNIQLDATGHYSVQLGITKPNGVPTALFTTGEARWLGVQIAEQPEQPRVLLLSVPYALKAGDAATIGGLPPSAFVLAAPANGAAVPLMADSSGQSIAPATSTDVTTSGGTVNYLPLWDSTSDIVSSVLFQSATAPFKIGINTATPATTLDVKGSATIRGTLGLPATGTATATSGADSQQLGFAASSFSSTTSKAMSQTFEWQAEPTANDTASPSGTLNLLFGAGAAKPAETGLYIASNGQINFATGQTFPGTGTITGITTATGSGLTGGAGSGTPSLSLVKTCATNQVLQWNGSAWACAAVGTGTVTSVASGTGLTGGPITGAGTLSIAGGGVSNAMLANPALTITAGAGLAGGGVVALGGSTTLNLSTNTCTTGNALTALPFTCSPFASLGANTFTGNQTVSANILLPNTNSGGTQGVIDFGGVPFIHNYGPSGSYNAFFGRVAGSVTNSGFYLTAVGDYALDSDTTGSYNTAMGYNAGAVNTTGSGNTFLGYQANPGASGLTNASAIGANAVVNQSNALVLGGTGANVINVGIGTATPAYTLDVLGSGLGAAGASAVGAYGFNNPSGTGGAGIEAVGGVSGCCGEFWFSGSGGFFTGGSADGSGAGDGIDAVAGSGGGGYAGYFTGDVSVAGTLTASTKDFKIDHPLDPANKYLFHASVESSEMINIYTGNVTTNEHGDARVELPGWFEAINTDFRYQLTVIGQFAQAIVSHEVANREFSIKTDKPDVKVSWQITGVRQDAYARAHPLVVEQEKNARERGRYIHPELYGASVQHSIEWARHPEVMQRIQAMTDRQLAAAQGQTTTTRSETQPSTVPTAPRNVRPPVLPAPVQKPGAANRQ